MIRFIFILILIPLIASIAAFSYRNAFPVSIDYFTAVIQLPMSVVLLLALLLGGVIGFCVNFMLLIALKNKIRHLNKQNSEMKNLSDVFKKSTDRGRL